MSEVIVPDNITQVSTANAIERAIAPAVQAAVKDPTVLGITEDPAEGERVAQAISQALAKEGFIAAVRKRFGLLTWSMFVASTGAIIATVELVQQGSSWEPIAGSVGAAAVTSAPIIKAFFPRFGTWVESFFQTGR